MLFVGEGLHDSVAADMTKTKIFCRRVQGNVEGVKVSQCDFVAVTYGIYAEHCLQARSRSGPAAAVPPPPPPPPSPHCPSSLTRQSLRSLCVARLSQRSRHPAICLKADGGCCVVDM